MPSMYIPDKVVCKVFVGLQQFERFQALTLNVLLRDVSGYVYKSMKVKSLKPLRLLVQFVACSRIARVLPSKVTSSAPVLLSFFHFSNTWLISSGLFPLDFSPDFLLSCTKSVQVASPVILHRWTTSRSWVLLELPRKGALWRLCQQVVNLLPTYSLLRNSVTFHDVIHEVVYTKSTLYSTNIFGTKEAWLDIWRLAMK